MSSLSYALAGAALLDQNRPGWFNEIDTDSLNQASTTSCVLGQLYGEYYSGLEALGGPSMEGRIQYGFSSDDDYDGLTEAWKQIVNSRLSGVPAPSRYTVVEAVTLGRQIMENRDTDALAELLAAASGGEVALFRAALAPLPQPLAPWERELLADQPPF